MRFKDDILKVKYKDLSVYELLNLGITEALGASLTFQNSQKTKTLTRCRARLPNAWTTPEYSSGGESKTVGKYMGSLSKNKLPSIYSW